MTEKTVKRNIAERRYLKAENDMDHEISLMRLMTLSTSKGL